mmetsp:Transcript_7736/g.22816  ORF Transcript_7736/g.22816 Transcript_7736/m.22816 type:complete len:328 (-) Transcript_7736:37-1020(-)
MNSLRRSLRRKRARCVGTFRIQCRTRRAGRRCISSARLATSTRRRCCSTGARTSTHGTGCKGHLSGSLARRAKSTWRRCFSRAEQSWTSGTVLDSRRCASPVVTATPARRDWDHDAAVDLTDSNGETPMTMVACGYGHADAARLLLQRGADIKWEDDGGWASTGRTLPEICRRRSHPEMAAWSARIQQAGGWARPLSQPRYALVVLRALVTRGRARRQRAFDGKERVLDFLFPSPGSGRPNTRAKRNQSCLPDDVFSIIARYYGGLSAELEEAAAAEAATRQASLAAWQAAGVEDPADHAEEASELENSADDTEEASEPQESAGDTE